MMLFKAVLIGVMLLAEFSAPARTDTLSVDIIPDFSTVGYGHGDLPYPDYPVTETITVESVARLLRINAYSDTTSVIQSAIDRAAKDAGGGTVLLKDGVYHIGGVLFLDKDRVVLRGESREGTIIRCGGTRQKRGQKDLVGTGMVLYNMYRFSIPSERCAPVRFPGPGLRLSL